jgi:replication factor A1
MAIADLEARQGKVDIVVEVVNIGESREFSKFGRTGKVATAIVKDETGEIKLSLWNEQVDMLKPGDKVHITNGYVNEFQGEKQLTAGKFGKLEVVSKGESKESVEENVE